MGELHSISSSYDDLNRISFVFFHFVPQIFWPETTDIYDRKNMPRVIYCIHALR